MKEEIILIGFFSETIELIHSLGISICGIIDGKDFRPAGCADGDIPYMGTDDVLNNSAFVKKYLKMPIHLCPDSPKVRHKLYSLYEAKGFKFVNIISTDSKISTSAKIIRDASVSIQYGANISSNVMIERGARINTYANIMHDCHIAEFATIAPNAVLLGRVTIEPQAYVGANATILPGLKIGRRAVVGAGAVVTKDVQDDEIVVGVPAKSMNKEER